MPRTSLLAGLGLLFLVVVLSTIYLGSRSGPVAPSLQPASDGGAQQVASDQAASRSREAIKEDLPGDGRGSAREGQETREEEAVEASVTAPLEDLSAKLDSVAQSFLTEEPDTIGLRNLLHDAARRAEVIEGSVQKTASGCTGKIRFPGTKLQASFEIIDGKYYQVALDVPFAQTGPFRLRSMNLDFGGEGDDVVRAGATVQFSPDTSRPPEPGMMPTCAGWSIISSESGATAGAIMVGEKDGMWQIGGLPHATRDETSEWGLNDFEVWRRVLRPHAGGN
jgi:hypothetical protein